MASAATASAPLQPAATVVRTIGRYELRKLIGKSAGTMTWLTVHGGTGDEWMLTLPRAQPGDAAALAGWRERVDYAARLDHPQLAPVGEVGVHEGWPYVAVARRFGQTLAERWSSEQHVAATDAAVWTAAMLRGLASAHESRCSHGELQAHHVLVDDDGNVRVMALGVASPPPDEAPGKPATAGADDQYGALQRQRGDAQRDVLAVALLLHRLLAGKPPFGVADTVLAMAQMPPQGRTGLRLPWSSATQVPDALRAITDRGTSVQPRERYLTARSFLQAIEGWLESDKLGGGGPIALLLDRLQTVGHLPAERGAAARLLDLARLDARRTDEIAEHILGDLALSFEMLRQVNAAQNQNPQTAGNGSVLTVRRCISLLGMDGVRRAASSLRAWPGPLGEEPAARLHRLIAHVRFAGRLAQALRPAGYDAEVVKLVTALQNLGRLLVQYHFVDEAAQIALLLKAQQDDLAHESTGSADDEAAYAVLGVGLEAMGAAVARQWGLGDDVLHMMRRHPAHLPVRAAHDDNDMLRTVASIANDLADAASNLPPAALPAAVTTIAKRHAIALGTTSLDLTNALAGARANEADARTGVEPLSRADGKTPPAPSLRRP